MFATQASFPTAAIQPFAGARYYNSVLDSWPSDRAGGAGLDNGAGYEIYAVWRMSSHVSFNGPAGREGRRKKAVGRKEGRRPWPGGVGKGLSLSVSYCAKLSLAQL